MGGGVDPAGEAGDHDKPAAPELCCKTLREPPTIRRGVARADDGNHRPPQQFGIAEHSQNGRRILDRRESARVPRLAPANEPGAGAVQRSQLGLRAGPAWRGDDRAAFAAAGKTRQRIEGRPRRTKTAQHRIKADRANRLGADEPQPVEALLRIEFACGQGLPQLLVSDIRLSVPATSRRMLVW